MRGLDPSIYFIGTHANQGRRPIPLDTPFAKDPSVHLRLSRRIKMRHESTDNAIGRRLVPSRYSICEERAIRPSIPSTNNAKGQRVIPLSIRLRRGRFDLLVHTSYIQGIRRRPTLLSILILQRETRSVVSTLTNNAMDGKWIIFLVLHRRSLARWIATSYRLSTIPSVTLA